MTINKPEDTAPLSKKVGFPQAEGKQTPKEDFDRNRDGLYGGRPEVRGGEPVGDTVPEK